MNTYAAYRVTDAQERVTYTNGKELSALEVEQWADVIGGTVEKRGGFATRDEALAAEYAWQGKPNPFTPPYVDVYHHTYPDGEVGTTSFPVRCF